MPVHAGTVTVDVAGLEPFKDALSTLSRIASIAKDARVDAEDRCEAIEAAVQCFIARQAED